MNPSQLKTPTILLAVCGALCLCLLPATPSHAADASEEMEKTIGLLKAQSALKGLDRVGTARNDLDQASKALASDKQTPSQVNEELARTVARTKDRERPDLLERLNAPDLNSHPDALRAAGAAIAALTEAAQHALVFRVAAMADDAAETDETRRDAYRLLGTWIPSLQGEKTKALSFDAALSPLRASPSQGRIAYRFEAIVGLSGSVEAVPTGAREEDGFARLLAGVLDDPRAAQRERQTAFILLKKLLAARPGILARDAANGSPLAQAVARWTPPAER